MPSGSKLAWMATDPVLGGCAPSTPEKPLRTKLMPDFLTTSQLLGGCAYSKVHLPCKSLLLCGTSSNPKENSYHRQ